MPTDVSGEIEGKRATATNPLAVNVVNNIVPKVFDSIDLTYVGSGNGVGEIETVIYKQGGVTVATLTLSYNVDDKLSGVVRS
jgi:hypothetical protein